MDEYNKFNSGSGIPDQGGASDSNGAEKDSSAFETKQAENAQPDSVQPSHSDRSPVTNNAESTAQQPVDPAASAGQPTSGSVYGAAPRQTYSNPTPAQPQYHAYRPVNSYTYQNGQTGYNQNPNFAPYGQGNPIMRQPAVHQAAPKKKSSISVTAFVICIVAAILLSSVSSAVVTSLIKSGSGTSANVKTTITNSTDNYVEAVANKVIKSVVGVVCQPGSSSGQNFFFGNNSSNEAHSEGSGVIYSSDGYIITNKHVVEYAISYNGSVQVYLYGDTKTAYNATVVGYDSFSDLAVLKIDKTGLTCADIGDSDKLTLGQNVVAIGNPGGLNFMGSVSVGYLSGINREVTIDTVTMKLLQTDASISPGNSGGALVDNEGKLIGITNSKLVSQGFEGMGFAIPIDTVTEVCDGIISGKGYSGSNSGDSSNGGTDSSQKPYLGVTIATNYTSDILQSYGLPAGVLVSSVSENGPADKAGIEEFDIITAADGQAVTSYEELVSIIGKHKVGDTMVLSVYHDRNNETVKVTLEASNG